MQNENTEPQTAEASVPPVESAPEAPAAEAPVESETGATGET